MEFTYDIGKLNTIINIGSEEQSSYTLADIANDATVCSLAATTDTSIEEIVQATFDNFHGKISMYAAIDEVKNFILDNGFPTTLSLLKYKPLLDWCEKNNVQDVQGALQEEFGFAPKCTIANIISTCESIRKDYL